MIVLFSIVLLGVVFFCVVLFCFVCVCFWFAPAETYPANTHKHNLRPKPRPADRSGALPVVTAHFHPDLRRILQHVLVELCHGQTGLGALRDFPETLTSHQFHRAILDKHVAFKATP